MTRDPIPAPYSDTELAWCAGFWDGEGCSRYRVTKHTKKDGRVSTYPVVSIQTSQTDPRPLERLRDATGIGSVTGPYRPTGTRQKPYWIWSAQSVVAVGLFGNLVVPFMCAPKQEQYLEAMRKWSMARGRR